MIAQMGHLPLEALSIPLLSIRSITRTGGTPECPPPAIDIACKDFRVMRLCFARDRECEQVGRLITALAFPSTIQDTFAFTTVAAANKARRSRAAASAASAVSAAALRAGPPPSPLGDPLGVTPPPVPPPEVDTTPFDATSVEAGAEAPGSAVDAASPFSAESAAAAAAAAISPGWSVFSFERELVRIGAVSQASLSGSDANPSPWRVTNINQEYRFSPTYPSVVCVPSLLSDREIAGIKSFRSRGRIPALTWRHPRNGATMWRSAQPRAGMTSATNADDERLVSLIRTSSGTKDPRSGLIIADCRPRTNAVANKMAGWGYEGPTYTNCTLWFLDIENIHRMRESVAKVEALALASPGDPQWGRAVEATMWLCHVRTVLQGAMRVAQALHRRGLPVLVHCSDGWDRTAQVCGLVQVLLDPFARTVQGFASLVEKEWLGFGHKFQCRLAHGSSKASEDKEVSPVFLQFLDCVFQLVSQFPAAFEFGPRLPLFLAHHSTSGRFGTFFFNNERERRTAMLAQRTNSVWDFVFGHSTLFQSFLYRPAAFGVDGSHPSILPPHPAPVLRQVRLWTDLYLRHSPVPSATPMQGPAAALVGGGQAAARALTGRLVAALSALSGGFPAEEMPPSDASSSGSAEEAVAALKALAASGLACGAEDAMLQLLAAVVANAEAANAATFTASTTPTVNATAAAAVAAPGGRYPAVSAATASHSAPAAAAPETPTAAELPAEAPPAAAESLAEDAAAASGEDAFAPGGGGLGIGARDVDAGRGGLGDDSPSVMAPQSPVEAAEVPVVSAEEEREGAGPSE